MNEDLSRISIEDILRDHDLVERATRDARRYRAREIRRMLKAAWRSLGPARKSERPALRTAACG